MIYVRTQSRVAAEVGLRFDAQVWRETIGQDDCKARILAMNEDPDVLGIILQRPLPPQIHVRAAIGNPAFEGCRKDETGFDRKHRLF